jgi:hypothetical protein
LEEFPCPGCHDALTSSSVIEDGITEQRQTSIEDELQLNQFHVYQLSGDSLMRDAQPNVLDFDEISLKRVVQSFFKGNEFGNLEYASQLIGSYDWSGACL